MYADQVENNGGGGRSSVRNRLYVAAGKRQREEDDKWKHNLQERSNLQISKSRIGAGDLRLKLQKRNVLQASQTAKGSVSGGVRDLREKLSGVTHSPLVETPKPVLEISKPARRSVIVEAVVPETKKARSVIAEAALPETKKARSVIAEAAVPQTKKARGVVPEASVQEAKKVRSGIPEAVVPETKKASSVPKKMTPQKPETVDSFLQAMGLEKYSITFQAEEVDMTALPHLTDADLKAMGIPMGPRKKILLALESKI